MTHEGEQSPSAEEADGKRHHMDAPVIKLNELIIAITAMLRRTLGEQVALSTSLSRDLWPTRADPSQFQSAILRLAVNGSDAMPNGGKLVVETWNVTLPADDVDPQSALKTGDYVQLAVSDIGAGTGRGAGVGLANVHGFIKQYGGHIRIISAVGQGTTFNLYLPRVEGAGVATTSQHGYAFDPNGRLIM